MMMQFSSSRPRAKAVLLTGCLVGVLDGAAALLNAWFRSGVSPAKVFRYIASAISGNAAYAQGWMPVAGGVILHFAVACIWSLVFFLLYPRVALLRGNKWLVGPCYGLFVWLAMNFAVLPLTRVPPLQFTTPGVISGLLIHMFIVGTPIPLMAAWWYRRDR